MKPTKRGIRTKASNPDLVTLLGPIVSYLFNLQNTKNNHGSMLEHKSESQLLSHIMPCSNIPFEAQMNVIDTYYTMQPFCFMSFQPIRCSVLRRVCGLHRC